MVWTLTLPNGIVIRQSGGGNNHSNEDEKSEFADYYDRVRHFQDDLFQVRGVDAKGKGKVMLRNPNMRFAVVAFRTVGLLLGPTLLAIGYALLQDWAREPGPQPS